MGCVAVKQASALHVRVTVADREPHATRLVIPQSTWPKQPIKHVQLCVCLRQVVGIYDSSADQCSKVSASQALYSFNGVYLLVSTPARGSPHPYLIVLTIFGLLLLSQLLCLFPLHREFSQLTFSPSACIHYVLGQFVSTVLWRRKAVRLWIVSPY